MRNFNPRANGLTSVRCSRVVKQAWIFVYPGRECHRQKYSREPSVNTGDGPPISSDAPVCADCGSIMTRNGSCYKCENCGSTSGCS